MLWCLRCLREQLRTSPKPIHLFPCHLSHCWMHCLRAPLSLPILLCFMVRSSYCSDVHRGAVSMWLSWGLFQRDSFETWQKWIHKEVQDLHLCEGQEFSCWRPCVLYPHYYWVWSVLCSWFGNWRGSVVSAFFLRVSMCRCQNIQRAHKSNHIYFQIHLSARLMNDSILPGSVKGVWCQKCHDYQCSGYSSPYQQIPEKVSKKIVEYVRLLWGDLLSLLVWFYLFCYMIVQSTSRILQWFECYFERTKDPWVLCNYYGFLELWCILFKDYVNDSTNYYGILTFLWAHKKKNKFKWEFERTLRFFKNNRESKKQKMSSMNSCLVKCLPDINIHWTRPSFFQCFFLFLFIVTIPNIFYSHMSDKNNKVPEEETKSLVSNSNEVQNNQESSTEQSSERQKVFSIPKGIHSVLFLSLFISS